MAKAKHYYTASVTYRTGDPQKGELVTRTITQDCTDEVLAGTSHEEICDRMYWKQVHPHPYFDVLSSGVSKHNKPA
jgi:hypothetical protein